MVRRLTILLCGVPLCLGLLSCQRISNPAEGAQLKTEPIKSLDAIPAEYGNLISVTQRGLESTLLWFERSDKTIVIVGVSAKGNTLSLAQNVVVIPRSSK